MGCIASFKPKSAQDTGHGLHFVACAEQLLQRPRNEEGLALGPAPQRARLRNQKKKELGANWRAKTADTWSMLIPHDAGESS